MRPSPRVRRLSTAATALAAGGLMLLPVPAVALPAAPADPGPVSGGAFQFVNLQTAKCATVAGGVSTANNIELVQFDCDTHPSRRWILTDYNGRSYRIYNDQTDRCATVAGGESAENDVGLVQFTCDTHRSRRWRITNWDSASGSYQIVNAGTGLCMTVAGGVATDNNVGLVQYACDAHPSRRWSLRLAG
ncbi:RICIN domain-containing protein [Streptomyces sp. NPDC007369]|uniref:RICIN domain-containing protein n=1 Tax=Streptomyces sp. NPDC007369 TaxID=3154589 RepID=UPI0033DF241F